MFCINILSCITFYRWLILHADVSKVSSVGLVWITYLFRVIIFLITRSEWSGWWLPTVWYCPLFSAFLLLWALVIFYRRKMEWGSKVVGCFCCRIFKLHKYILNFYLHKLRTLMEKAWRHWIQRVSFCFGIFCPNNYNINIIYFDSDDNLQGENSHICGQIRLNPFCLRQQNWQTLMWWGKGC